ncbi:MAG: spore photoproduct lyase, partial [Syntrophomonas sp.]
FFEQDALKFPLGKYIYQTFKDRGLKAAFLQSHNRVTGIPGKTQTQAFVQGKNTLVIGVRKGLEFSSCKPSAHFQLPLVTGCPGMCQYCYLNTNLGKKPYTRLYVNVDEILHKAETYIKARQPEITVFEASATADPVPVESISGALTKAINFFSGQELGRLRLATKFPCPESILSTEHRGHTRIRYSLNTPAIIARYERRTPSLDERIEALGEVIKRGYPSGILLAPVFLEDGWEQEYLKLLHLLKERLGPLTGTELHFEIISHRFTKRARQVIDQVFSGNQLPMDEEKGRRFKFGQFGYGKYIYTPDRLEEMKSFFNTNLPAMFPQSVVEYMI